MERDLFGLTKKFTVASEPSPTICDRMNLLSA